MKTSVTDNELVQKNNPIYHGRGLFPKMGATHKLHSPPGSTWEGSTRAQEMKGFKKENKDYGKHQEN